MANKVFSMIGLAERAGKVVSGEFSTEKAVKSKKACLVVLASDASANTRKHFSDMCAYRNIPLCIYGNKEELGHAIGKQMRANLAVTDQGFADSIRERIKEAMRN
ncbi:50S ribosomal protein L7ae [bacterium 1XD8-76]|mgnify:FL=1|nr:50S ribosomal protein L7ae [bacterium 1XD8-76]